MGNVEHLVATRAQRDAAHEYWRATVARDGFEETHTERWYFRYLVSSRMAAASYAAARLWMGITAEDYDYA